MRFTLRDPGDDELHARRGAAAGYRLLPAAIGATAATVMFGVWQFLGPPKTALSGYAFIALGAVFVLAGGWVAKEWLWPTRSRAPG
ncbi:MAG TPA: hypothetical protein VFR87_01225 [Nocardioidaceae bacterium]|nr:hypothetical protein [Nocardioidaceae bacterium]